MKLTHTAKKGSTQPTLHNSLLRKSLAAAVFYWRGGYSEILYKAALGIFDVCLVSQFETPLFTTVHTHCPLRNTYSPVLSCKCLIIELCACMLLPDDWLMG